MTALGTAIVGVGGDLMFTTEALPDGDHSFTATASDYAGAESAHSAARDVTVDTVAPPDAIFTGITNDSGVDTGDELTNTTSIALLTEAPLSQARFSGFIHFNFRPGQRSAAVSAWRSRMPTATGNSAFPG